MKDISQMQRSTSDLQDTSTSEFRRLTDEELVGLVAHGRMSDSGSDNKRARSAWEELVLREFDRVNQLVKVFRFPERPDVRVAPDDVDDAMQAAFMRLLGMFDNFRGTSVVEFRAALITCVRYACMDYCRAELRIDVGLGGSLDDEIKDDDGSSRGRFEAEIGRRERERAAAQEAARDQVQRIGAALARIENEQMRLALSFSWEGLSAEEISAELGISTDNVYQLRSRGQRKLLADLYGEGDGEGADGDA